MSEIKEAPGNHFFPNFLGKTNYLCFKKKWVMREIEPSLFDEVMSKDEALLCLVGVESRSLYMMFWPFTFLLRLPTPHGSFV